VEQNENPLFYEYLRSLKKEIGVGMSINTSFNRNQEPMIHNPIEAVSAFYGSGMDALVIGNFILEKTNTR
jgi:carbamoyltransferase